MTPYERGRYNHEESNPFPKGTPEHAEWNSGRTKRLEIEEEEIEEEQNRPGPPM
jgi:hypothetical protein